MARHSATGSTTCTASRHLRLDGIADGADALRSKIQELTYAPDGGVAACGGLNLFGPNSISAACADYIAVDATNRAGYDQTVAEVSLTGSALELPAGDLGLALGLMYKRDEFSISRRPARVRRTRRR